MTTSIFRITATVTTFGKFIIFCFLLLSMVSCQKDSLNPMETIVQENNTGTPNLLIPVTTGEVEFLPGDNPHMEAFLKASSTYAIAQGRSSSAQNEFDIAGAKVGDLTEYYTILNPTNTLSLLAVGTLEEGLQTVIFEASPSFSIVHTEWSKAGDKIAFVIQKRDKRIEHLMTINADGTNLIGLTTVLYPTKSAKGIAGLADINWIEDDQIIVTHLRKRGRSMIVETTLVTQESNFRYHDHITAFDIDELGNKAFSEKTLPFSPLLSNENLRASLQLFDPNTGDQENWLNSRTL